VVRDFIKKKTMRSGLWDPWIASGNKRNSMGFLSFQEVFGLQQEEKKTVSQDVSSLCRHGQNVCVMGEKSCQVICDGEVIYLIYGHLRVV